MDTKMIERVINEGLYLTNTDQTLRETAKYFKVSKSTVHKDLKERLPKIDINLSKLVLDRLEKHLRTRHLKGGLQTKLKYQKLK